MRGKRPGVGPASIFNSFAPFPTADFKTIVRPNFDTLYSSAFLDMTTEPVVVSAPDTGGFYYLLPMLDNVDRRVRLTRLAHNGRQAGNFLITSSGWTGAVLIARRGSARRRPTFGSLDGQGRTDRQTTRRLTRQAGYKITPACWSEDRPDSGYEYAAKGSSRFDARRQVFPSAAELLKVNPPHITDWPMIAQLKKIGLEPGKSFDMDKPDPTVRNALAKVPEEAQQLMAWKIPTLARVANGWSMNADTVGVHGNYYLERAIAAPVGLGANLPEDAIYPINLGDEAGRPLDGTSSIRSSSFFAKSDTPPANAFRSVTLYDSEGFQVANPLNRFVVSSWMPLKYNADGSLDLYQNETPGADKEANWLPAPKDPFNLTMRLCAPNRRRLRANGTRRQSRACDHFQVWTANS